MYIYNFNVKWNFFKSEWNDAIFIVRDIILMVYFFIQITSFLLDNGSIRAFSDIKKKYLSFASQG